MYRIEIAGKARRKLLRLPTMLRERIAEAIGMLAANPRDPVLDVKRLVNDGEARYRLRVGHYRIKFNKDDKAGVIRIVRIGDRKEIYR